MWRSKNGLQGEVVDEFAAGLVSGTSFETFLLKAASVYEHIHTGGGLRDDQEAFISPVIWSFPRSEQGAENNLT